MAATYKDYYKLLGVERNATDEAIAHAFKKLARKYHPDLNPNNKQAEERFKEINEAYEVLKDPEKRKLYDQLGPNWQQGQAFNGNAGFNGSQFHFNGKNFDGAGFSDFFETLFGDSRSTKHNPFGADPFAGFRNRPRRGQDIEAELALSLEEIMAGGKRKVTVRTPEGPKELEVSIPVGIQEGKKLRLIGQGGQVAGGTAGDLFLQIRYLPHPRFRVQENNLVCDVLISPWEAVLGCHVAVRTLTGEVDLTIPAGTSSGRKFRLRGMGLGSSGNRGDILVQAMICVPNVLRDEEKALWEKLAAQSSYSPR